MEEKLAFFFLVGFCSILSIFSSGMVHIPPWTKRIPAASWFARICFFIMVFFRFVLYFNTRLSKAWNLHFDYGRFCSTECIYVFLTYIQTMILVHFCNSTIIIFRGKKSSVKLNEIGFLNIFFILMFSFFSAIFYNIIFRIWINLPFLCTDH